MREISNRLHMLFQLQTSIKWSFLGLRLQESADNAIIVTSALEYCRKDSLSLELIQASRLNGRMTRPPQWCHMFRRAKRKDMFHVLSLFDTSMYITIYRTQHPHSGRTWQLSNSIRHMKRSFMTTTSFTGLNSILGSGLMCRFSLLIEPRAYSLVGWRHAALEFDPKIFFYAKIGDLRDAIIHLNEWKTHKTLFMLPFFSSSYFHTENRSRRKYCEQRKICNLWESK